MTHDVGKSDSPQRAPTIPGLPPNLRKKIPTIDDLMGRRPPPEDWWDFLPPPAPRSPDPFHPVPIMPAPIDVDPSLRPPMWRHGPPYITETPQQVPFGSWSTPPLPAGAAARGASGGLPDMMMRAGVIDPSSADALPPGGLVGLLQDYLRTNPHLRD